MTATPVYEIDQLLDDPHVQERGVIVEAPDEEAGSVLMHNVIPRLSDTPGELRLPAPSLGQHTHEILHSNRLRRRADRRAGGRGGVSSEALTQTSKQITPVRIDAVDQRTFRRRNHPLSAAPVRCRAHVADFLNTEARTFPHCSHW